METHKLQLAFAASNLQNVAKSKHPFRKKTSSPFAVIMKHPANGGPPDILGQTEVVEDSLNPNWQTQFVIDYDEHFPPYLNVYIFDHGTIDKNREYVTITQTAGYTIMDCIEVLRMDHVVEEMTKGYVYETEMHLKGGRMKIFAEVLTGEARGNTALLHFRGLKLRNIEKVGLLKGLIDPYFEVWKLQAKRPEKQWCLAYRSEKVDNHINPFWQPFRIDMNSLCGGDSTRPIRILVYDWESGGKHRLIGEVTTLLEDLIGKCRKAKGNGDLQSSLKLISKEYPESTMGALVVLKAIIETPSEEL